MYETQLNCLGWYRSVQRGMETLPGPGIKVEACHCLKNNSKHKRAADNHVNHQSIRCSPEKRPKFGIVLYNEVPVRVEESVVAR